MCFAGRSTIWWSSSRRRRTRWPATCTPTTPRRGMPSSWPRAGTCRCCACSTITPTWRPAWPSTDWQGPVLGFSWDGTGYGPDGTVWGGEVLLCEGAEFRRVAHLRHVRPARRRSGRARAAALGLGPAVRDLRPSVRREHAGRLVQRRANSTRCCRCWPVGVNAPRTSSMGRLFDAVAALCGLPPVISFEGQAAMALEFAADESEEEAYPIALPPERSRQRRTPSWPTGSRWSRSVLADRAAGVPVGRISARFHNALAELAVAIARRHVAVACRSQTCRSCSRGGCFQNALLDRPASAAPAVGGRLFRCILISRSRRATAASPWGKCSSPCKWPSGQVDNVDEGSSHVSGNAR